MRDFDVNNLRRWFLMDQRDLPWRQNISTYGVWISEVMLQQTQVSVVIPYFERWMQKFPTVDALAKASLDEVLKAWEGLGYYSRARNLHEGAKQLLLKFNGELPSDEHSLLQIKGLGHYTVGAIRAFAFRQKAAAVDGNVLRVISRHDLIFDEITKSTTVNKIRSRVLEILPEEAPWEISEALIELGATLCGKNPRCAHCPLQKTCGAFATGKVNELPMKSPKVKITPLYRMVSVIISGGHCLIRRGEKGKIMSDLYEFPYCETDEKGLEVEYLQNKINAEWNLNLSKGIELEAVSHGFTRFKVRLTPIVFLTDAMFDISGYQWMSFQELDQLPFSSGHRKIYGMIQR